LLGEAGLKGGYSYPYVDAITYDCFEQRNYIKYGQDGHIRPVDELR